MLSLILQQTLTDQLISDIDIKGVLIGYISISSNQFALLFSHRKNDVTNKLKKEILDKKMRRKLESNIAF